MLRSRAAHQGRVIAALDYVTSKLQVGDWKLLHILGMNIEPLVFGELVVELAVELLDTMALLLFLPVVGSAVVLDEADLSSCVLLTPLSKLGLSPVLLLLEVSSTTRLAPVV